MFAARRAFAYMRLSSCDRFSHRSRLQLDRVRSLCTYIDNRYRSPSSPAAQPLAVWFFNAGYCIFFFDLFISGAKRINLSSSAHGNAANAGSLPRKSFHDDDDDDRSSVFIKFYECLEGTIFIVRPRFPDELTSPFQPLPSSPPMARSSLQFDVDDGRGIPCTRMLAAGWTNPCNDCE